jgi:hypothetical protein
MIEMKTIVAAIGIAGLLGGCAVSGEHAEDFYVAPGKYIFYDCKQLAGVAAHFGQRDKELKDLMARAKRGAGGELVSAMAYNSDYYSNLGELKDVRREQAEKKCDPHLTAPPMTPPEPKPVKQRKRR